MKEVLADMNTAVTESKAKIEIQKLPTLYAYPMELKLLLQNLVSNAIKFRAKKAKLEITISARKKSRFWNFSVEDNGIGIPRKYHDKIFVIFKRLNSRSEYDGTGIGLAHCKKIVELHGGRIWVESKPGKGSTFHFTIPEEKL